MANRFPLIVDSSSNQIKELEASDNIDLTNSGIVNAQSISATHLNLSGVVTASSFSGNGSGLTGVASTDNIQTATSANFLSNVNIAGITTCQALTVSGNLTVDGTTTTINSTTLTVDDKTIVIASGAADSSAADGAGISIDGASATILYSHSGTKFVSNKPFEATSFSGDGSGLTGVASTDNIQTATVANFLDGITVAGVTTTSSNVNVTGNVTVTGDVTANDFNSTSDVTLKQDVSVIDNALEMISQLEGVSWKWKETLKPSLGVTAQNVETVAPELVCNGSHKSVNYNGLIGILIEAVKELKSEVDELKR